MPHNIIRLKNGLRLIHKEVNSPVSHFGVLVNAGSRDEHPDQMGMAHFVEHTIFKGTKRRNAYHVISRMEAVGGDLNASTSKEVTYFHSSFLSADYARAVELLSDIFFNALFPEKELEREKTVVLEEIKYYKDAPAEQIFDDFEDQIFAGHPLGKNILGTRQSVCKIQRQGILDFIVQNYTLNHVVLASVGNISTRKLVSLCERYFGQKSMQEIPRVRTPFANYTPIHRVVKKKSSQAHVMMGQPTYSLREEKRVPFMLLNNLLGGQGMNTRLNMSVREKRGLAYTIESNYTAFSDCGLFAIYFGCDTHNVDLCREIVYKELQKLCQQKLGAMQLYYAKKQFIGQLALSNEGKLNEMITLGNTALFFDEVDTLEESIAEMEAVTAEQLLEVANETFINERFSTLIFTH